MTSFPQPKPLSSADATALHAWLSRSLARMELLPPSEGRVKSIAALKERLASLGPSERTARFIAKLQEDYPISDWLDRRAAFDADQRRCEGEDTAIEWLGKHDRRFGGKEAE